MRNIPESCLAGLDPFYAKILHSYTEVNNLFYEWNKRNKNDKSYLDLPINLWCHPESKNINHVLSDSGFCVVADLPLENGKIDFKTVQCKVFEKGYKCNVYLACYALQTAFLKDFGNNTPGTHLIHPSLLEQAKELSHCSHSCMLSLTKWEHYFKIIPLSMGEKQVIFRKMLKDCKISQFREINFKILSCILVTPKMLSKIRNEPTLS